MESLKHWNEGEDCGEVYYYNNLTQETLYEDPFQLRQCVWERLEDDGGVYYYNTQVDMRLGAAVSGRYRGRCN